MTEHLAKMSKLLLEVNGDMDKLAGKELEQYLFCVEQQYLNQFARLVANALLSVPEDQRTVLMHRLQEDSSVFESGYERHMQIQMPEQVLDESFVLSDSDKLLLEDNYISLEQGLLSFADLCVALRACNIEVLFFESNQRTFRLLKIKTKFEDDKEIMVRGRTEEYKIKS